MPEPKGIITAAEAKKLSDNWKNLRASETDRAAGQPDNCSCWYSFQDMQDFLDLIKAENPNVNGVRFYMGVKTSAGDPKGLANIFMVPTTEKDGINRDIPNARGMDRGDLGDPPQSGYPQ
ncbi:hypothetical protein [Lacinutrix sp. Hel_I_90]|uniref:hypothetical protein n=1 Tax=Lacinutrix sp. Hel_I_90 TaxID=1249999 RepID=UPI0005CB665F|nr:hypothetical protein [Lacinutrix sp. Hel_I_90]